MLDPLGPLPRPSDHGPDAKPASCQHCGARAEDECTRCGGDLCREHRRHCIGECSKIYCYHCAFHLTMQYSVCEDCPEHWANYQEVAPLTQMYRRALLHNKHLDGLKFLDWTENYLDLAIFDTEHVPECRVAEIRTALLKLLPEHERRSFELEEKWEPTEKN